MKKIVKEEKIIDEVYSIECDRCHKEVTRNDIFELQEFVSLDIHCGYGSKTWGDLHQVEVDFCEQCIYDLVAEYARVTRYA